MMPHEIDHNSKQLMLESEYSFAYYLPSKSFSQFFRPKIASIVCRGVMGPSFRAVSPAHKSSEMKRRHKN